MRSIVESRHPWRRVREFLRLDELSPVARRVLVGTVGTTVLLIGVAMMLLPGPAFIVIPLGLVILATEFLWARRILRKVRGVFTKAKKAVS